MPAPVFVERVRQNIYSGGNPVAVATDGTTVAGNTLFLALWAIEGQPTGVTCGSDTLTLVDSFTGADGYFYSAWEKLNIIGGGTSYSVAFSGATFLGGTVRAEMSGVNSVGPILNATGTGTAVSEPFTTTAAEGVAIALVRDTAGGAASLTAGSGYTSEIGGGSNAMLYSTDLGTAGSEDMTGTWDVSATWALIGRVYYPTGSGASIPRLSFATRQLLNN